MISVPSYSLHGKNLGKVCQNSRAGENPQLCFGFSLGSALEFFQTFASVFTWARLFKSQLALTQR